MSKKSKQKKSIVAEQPIQFTHEMAIGAGLSKEELDRNVFEAYKPLKGVLPEGVSSKFALDSLPVVANANSLAIQYAAMGEGLYFFGFPFLAELAQRPEFRRISETIATDMTSKWIKIKAKGNDNKTDQVKALEAEFERCRVRDVFKEAAEHDGLFGRGHIYIDTGVVEGSNEDATNIGNGVDAASRNKIKQGDIKGFRTVEPVWTYPSSMNTTSPLREDFYKPRAWYVMGEEVHASRLLTLIGREMPDILKPAYAFGGLSLTQMSKPYVDNWIRTRQGVSDLIVSFSVSGIKTNLRTAIGQSPTAGTNIFNRVQFFQNMRSNKGVMLLDKEEDFFNVSTALGTLDKLQAQSQEQVCSITKIPLVKYTGISPSGLNASSEGEIRVYYDDIKSAQESLFGQPLNVIFNMLQINIWGKVDPDLTYEFVPLWEMNEKEKADIRKTQADIDVLYVQEGIVDSGEVRERIAHAEDSPYHGLDLDKTLNPPLLGENDNEIDKLLPHVEAAE